MELGLALALLHVLICIMMCGIQVYMFESTDGEPVLWAIAILTFLITIPFYMMLDTSVGYIFNKIVGG